MPTVEPSAFTPEQVAELDRRERRPMDDVLTENQEQQVREIVGQELQGAAVDVDAATEGRMRELAREEIGRAFTDAGVVFETIRAEAADLLRSATAAQLGDTDVGQIDMADRDHYRTRLAHARFDPVQAAVILELLTAVKASAARSFAGYVLKWLGEPATHPGQSGASGFSTSDEVAKPEAAPPPALDSDLISYGERPPEGEAA